VTVTDNVSGISAFRNVSLFIVGAQASLMNVSVSPRIDCSFGVPCSFTAGANNGGVPPLTWSATGLPPGMDIRYGEGATTSWVTGGDGEVWGVATSLGDYEAFITVTDDDGRTATNRVVIHVSPLWIAQYFPGASYDVPYSQALRVIGGEPFYTAAEVGGSWPIGMSLNSGTLVLSGTPGETGSFNRTVVLEDTAGNQLQAFLNVFVAGPGTTLQMQTGADLGFIQEGIAFSRQLFACCVPTQSWSVVGGALPPGLALTSTGLLQGTPTTAGTYAFLVEVVDADFPLVNFARRQFTIVVTPLSITTAFTLPFGQVGSAYPYPSGAGVQLSVTGGTGPYTWALTGQLLPPGITLSSSGLLSGTPTHAGRFFFNATVTDSVGNGQRLFANV
jgi:hypothetical protein